MSQKSVELFLGRLVTDDDFRHRAHIDLLRTCSEQGFVLTEVEKKLLEQMDLDAFVLPAKKLNDGLKRAAGICR